MSSLATISVCFRQKRFDGDSQTADESTGVEKLNKKHRGSKRQIFEKTAVSNGQYKNFTGRWSANALV